MFDRKHVEINEVIEARKVKIADDQAWEVLKYAEEIVVGRGKKYLVFSPSEDNKVEILNQCLGRTGSLRAPTLKIDNRYVVGFNEEMYQKYIG